MKLEPFTHKAWLLLAAGPSTALFPPMPALAPNKVL